jgi:DNA-binding beta-propeller fold protein YncE
VTTDYIEQSIPVQERPKGVSFPPVEWFIITADNVDSKVAEIEERTGDVAIFAITPQGYENLAVGIADLRRYVKEQDAIIAYYEEAVTPDEENTD